MRSLMSLTMNERVKIEMFQKMHKDDPKKPAAPAQ